MDQDSRKLIGIPVLVAGTTNGAVSDTNGLYTLVLQDMTGKVIVSTDWGGSIPFHPGSAHKVDVIPLDNNWIHGKINRRQIEKNRKKFNPFSVVKGLLLDQSHTPLTNIRLEVQGMNESYTTDSEGRYELSVPFGVVGVVILHNAKSAASVEYLFRTREIYPQPWSKKMARLWGIPFSKE